MRNLVIVRRWRTASMSASAFEYSHAYCFSNRYSGALARAVVAGTVCNNKWNSYRVVDTERTPVHPEATCAFCTRLLNETPIPGKEQTNGND